MKGALQSSPCPQPSPRQSLLRVVFVCYELTWVFLCSYRIIVETDSTTIASRVSRPKADTTEIVINEQTIMNAYQTMKEKMTQRIAVGF